MLELIGAKTARNGPEKPDWLPDFGESEVREV